MTKINPDVNSGLSWLEKILQLYKTYGVLGIVKGLFLLIMFSITLRLCYNPTFLFEKYTEYVTQRHNKELYARSEYDQQIKNLLPIYLYKYHADRVWIIQYHNGVMDWQHGTMRFELCNSGVKSIQNQYNNFNLTWIHLPYYLKDNDVFIGSLEELWEIDPILYMQFETNGIKYVACTVIKDNSGYPIGVFGVTWEHISANMEALREKIYNYLLEDRGTIRPLIQVNSITK